MKKIVNQDILFDYYVEDDIEFKDGLACVLAKVVCKSQPYSANNIIEESYGIVRENLSSITFPSNLALGTSCQIRKIYEIEPRSFVVEEYDRTSKERHYHYYKLDEKENLVLPKSFSTSEKLTQSIIPYIFKSDHYIVDVRRGEVTTPYYDAIDEFQRYRIEGEHKALARVQDTIIFPQRGIPIADSHLSFFIQEDGRLYGTVYSSYQNTIYKDTYNYNAITMDILNDLAKESSSPPPYPKQLIKGKTRIH